MNEQNTDFQPGHHPQPQAPYTQPQQPGGQQQMPYGQPPMPGAQPYYYSPQPQQPKSSNRLLLGIIIFLLVVIAAGAGGFYYYIHSDNEAAAAIRAYDALEESYSSDDYKSFLERFPDSEFAPDVRRRMQKIMNMEREWDYIHNSADANTFVRFKNKYANPLYDRLCDNKIDSLDWINTKNTDSWDAYTNYMSKHPNGMYYADASNAKLHCTEPKKEPVTSNNGRQDWGYDTDSAAGYYEVSDSAF